MEKVIEQPLVDLKLPPIDPISSVEGWKTIPIKENGELLMPLNGFHPFIHVEPQYKIQGIKHAISTQYVRTAVGAALQKAVKLLPKDYSFEIWDAWRPLEVQQALFEDHVAMLRKQNSNAPVNKLEEEAQIFVSLPSYDPKRPSPHNTGGAVDLTIRDEYNVPLDMGTDFDHFGPKATTTYYEDPVNIREPEDILRRDNRRLLADVLTSAGFSFYAPEWWHVDLGNQFDAARTGKSIAIYGRITL